MAEPRRSKCIKSSIPCKSKPAPIEPDDLGLIFNEETNFELIQSIKLNPMSPVEAIGSSMPSDGLDIAEPVQAPKSNEAVFRPIQDIVEPMQPLASNEVVFRPIPFLISTSHCLNNFKYHSKSMPLDIGSSYVANDILGANNRVVIRCEWVDYHVTCHWQALLTGSRLGWKEEKHN